MLIKELQRLNTEYKTYSRLLWKLAGNIPSGAIGRAFKAYRKDPNWYLCNWLQQDCRGRGGCCARDCGCYNRTRATSSSRMAWNKGYGHCTSACSCCIRTLGDSHSHPLGEGKVDKRTDLRNFPFDIVARDSKFSIRTLYAYIFGLNFLDELDVVLYYN